MMTQLIVFYGEGQVGDEVVDLPDMPSTEDLKAAVAPILCMATGLPAWDLGLIMAGIMVNGRAATLFVASGADGEFAENADASALYASAFVVQGDYDPWTTPKVYGPAVVYQRPA